MAGSQPLLAVVEAPETAGSRFQIKIRLLASALLLTGGSLAMVTLMRPRVHSHITSLAAAADEGGGWCEYETGGTCFVHGCSPKRNATCSFGMCLCEQGSCKDEDGVCRGGWRPLSPPTLLSPTWARQKLEWLCYTMYLSIIGRAGLLSCFMHCVTGRWRRAVGSKLDRGMGLGRGHPAPAAPTKTTTWDWKWSWQDAKSQYSYEDDSEAVQVAVAKLVVVHLLQPLSFFVAFYSYFPLMEEWQLRFGLVVVLREVFYIVVALVAAAINPAFLLFQPFTESDVKCIVYYMCSPIGFVASGVVESDLRWEICAYGSAWADLCAIGALCAGMTGWGAMWPALSAGYACALLSPASVVFILVTQGCS